MTENNARDGEARLAPEEAARRRFLAGVAGAAGLSLAPGVLLYGLAEAKAPDAPVTDRVRWGLLIDTTKCATDCDVCVRACQTENGWGENEKHSRPDQRAHWIRKLTVKDPSSGHVMSLPMMCQHCETAPCADVCPTGASFRRIDGVVLVDKHICIGCRYCMMACPYKARSFVHETLEGQKPHAPRGKGTVESCTLCVHRVDAGEQPACVVACNEAGGKAMLFGDLKDPDSEIAQEIRARGATQVRADLQLNPGVRYRGF